MARRKTFYLALRESGAFKAGSITSEDKSEHSGWVPIKTRVRALDRFRPAAHNLQPTTGGWVAPDPFKLILWYPQRHVFAALGFHAGSSQAEAISISRTTARQQYNKSGMRHVVRPVVFEASDPQDLQRRLVIQHEDDMGGSLWSRATALSRLAAGQQYNPMTYGEETELDREAARAREGWKEFQLGRQWAKLRLDDARALMDRIREALWAARERLF